MTQTASCTSLLSLQRSAKKKFLNTIFVSQYVSQYCVTKSSQYYDLNETDLLTFIIFLVKIKASGLIIVIGFLNTHSLGIQPNTIFVLRPHSANLQPN